MSTSLRHLLLLGCGYTGLALTRLAKARGLRVTATTRSTDRRGELEQAGAEALVLPRLSRQALEPLLDGHTALIASFPPDGQSDAECAPLCTRAFSSVYVSSTGVYGALRGRVDDQTPVSLDSVRARERHQAEQHWLAHGTTVLRAAAIYGPFRGQHERVRAGSARIAGDGSHYVCRIHVDDLAQALLRAAELRLGAQSFVIADDEPARQGEVIRYLAQLLQVPTPASVPLEAAPETLRNDRQVDASRFKQLAQINWRYPSYRVGFPACLAAEQAQQAPG